MVCNSFKGKGLPAAASQEHHPEALPEPCQQRHCHKVLQAWREGRTYRSLYALAKQTAWTYIIEDIPGQKPGITVIFPN